MINLEKSHDNIAILNLDDRQCSIVYKSLPTDMTFIWNTAAKMDIVVDNVCYVLCKNDIIFVTSFNTINSITIEAARMIRFNESFFRILNSGDGGIKNLLYAGGDGSKIISIPENELRSFEISWEIFCMEMQSRNRMQKYMFQTNLQRMIILFSRNVKPHELPVLTNATRDDICRKFNFLVEDHFLQHHDVGFYASKLNKSPKTLSNLFTVVMGKSPISIIHDRIMLHAKRQICHTGLSIKQIAFEMGYEDIQTFSRFFKNKEGISPVQYRERAKVTSAGVRYQDVG